MSQFHVSDQHDHYENHLEGKCFEILVRNKAAQQTNVYFTGIKKAVLFIRSLILPEQKQTDFSVQISSGWSSTPSSKFEQAIPKIFAFNSLSYYLCIFFLSFFCNLFLKLLHVTHACFNGLPNLGENHSETQSW